MMGALWFYDHGVGVFPLVYRTKDDFRLCEVVIRDGKPVHSWPAHTSTREHAARFRNYGVRLGACRMGLLGVADADSAEKDAWIRAHMPATLFQVSTGPYHGHDDEPERGRHFYYRMPFTTPDTINRDGLSTEFRNVGRYVVGPGSTHPTHGDLYTPSDWSWRWEDIPMLPVDFVFNDGSCGVVPSEREPGTPFVLPAVIYEGGLNGRHHVLHSYACHLKWQGADEATAWAWVRFANETRCQPPRDEDDAKNEFERSWANCPDRPPLIDPFEDDL